MVGWRLDCRHHAEPEPVELAAPYGAKPAPAARGARSAPDRRQPKMLLPVTGAKGRKGRRQRPPCLRRGDGTKPNRV